MDKGIILKDNMEYFENRVFFWQDNLKLSNLEYYVNFISFESKSPRALWNYSDSNALVSITGNKKWLLQDLPEKKIDKTIFHEVYESMFCQIYMYMENFYNEKMVNNLIHQIVNRAENSIYDNLK